MNAIQFQLVKKINNNLLEENTNFEYKDKKYTLFKFTYGSGRTSYSVHGEYHRAMNVDKITSKYISLYSYDMMGQRTNYKMSLLEIKF
jgi:hypothetical protein